MNRGRLIVFEGPEGAGKSTQVARLERHLVALRTPCTLLREPGGTRVGEKIRELLLDPHNKLEAAAESLLFMASRAELVQGVISPALARGTTVLLDRFFLSTYAYQIAGRGLPEDAIRASNMLATKGLVPDLTLLLSIDAEAGLQRASKRGAKDRMESMGSEFHNRVASAFRSFADEGWQKAHPECGPIVELDAAKGEEDVFASILDALAARWPELLATHAQEN